MSRGPTDYRGMSWPLSLKLPLPQPLPARVKDLLPVDVLLCRYKQRSLFANSCCFRNCLFLFVLLFTVVDALKSDALAAAFLDQLRPVASAYGIANITCTIFTLISIQIVHALFDSIVSQTLPSLLPPFQLTLYSFAMSVLAWASFTVNSGGYKSGFGDLILVLLLRSVTARVCTVQQWFYPARYCHDNAVDRSTPLTFMDIEPRFSLHLQLGFWILVPGTKIFLFTLWPEMITSYQFGVFLTSILAALAFVIFVFTFECLYPRPSVEDDESVDSEDCVAVGAARRRPRTTTSSSDAADQFVVPEHRSVKIIETIANAYSAIMSFDFPFYTAYAVTFQGFNLTFHAVYLEFFLRVIMFAVALTFQTFNDFCLDLSEISSARMMVSVRYCYFFLAMFVLVGPMIAQFALAYVYAGITSVDGHLVSTSCLGHLIGAALCISGVGGAFKYILRQFVEQERRWRCRHQFRGPATRNYWSTSFCCVDIPLMFGRLPHGPLFGALLLLITFSSINALSLWIVPIVSAALLSLVIMSLYLWLAHYPVVRSRCIFV
jgi:hypothetical protein